MFERLERSRLYHEYHVPEFGFSCVDRPTHVAPDGEADGLHEHATFAVRYRILPVFSLLPRR